MMHVELHYGRAAFDVEVDSARIVEMSRATLPSAEVDSTALVQRALDSPVDFPPLRHALTPDDHVAIVADTNLPDWQALCIPVVEHIVSTGIALGRITVIVSDTKSQLPDHIGGARIERHDPEDRSRFAYVATTAAGRRVYLNRTAVEADQLVVLSELRHDPRGGLSGGIATLFPALSDSATRADLREVANTLVADEAKEVCWLFGLPFFICVIAGHGGGVHRVIAGALESLVTAKKILKSCWVLNCVEPADLAIATVAGNDIDMSELAAALTHASGVVEPGGIIVLLTSGNPEIGPGLAIANEATSPAGARKLLDSKKHADFRQASQWLRAVHRHRVMVLSGWADDVVEDLFATPLQNQAQVQRLIDAAERCVIMPDANRLYAHIHNSDKGRE